MENFPEMGNTGKSEARIGPKYPSQMVRTLPLPTIEDVDSYP